MINPLRHASKITAGMRYLKAVQDTIMNCPVEMKRKHELLALFQSNIDPANKLDPSKQAQFGEKVMEFVCPACKLKLQEIQEDVARDWFTEKK